MTNKATWEDSFDEQFPPNLYDQMPKAKDFIHSLLQTQRKELMEAAETGISRLEVEVKPTHAEENGYGCALDDCRTLITSILSQDT